MDASISHLERLLELLSNKTGKPLTVKGLKAMTDKLDLSSKYLYEYIYRKKEKAKESGETTINVQESKLDIIVKFIDGTSYQQFIITLEQPVNPILQSLIGNYYSYVRRNDEQGFILRSPARIHEQQGKILFELKGPMRLYYGEVKYRHGCLFILLEEEAGKQIHHVYKIGTRPQPEVLQGIFSGVSTNFDPIGGRTVLVRGSADFDTLRNKEASIKDFSRSDLPAEKAIAMYLKEYSLNNLRINRVVKFGEADL